MKRLSIFYILVLAIAGAAIAGVLQLGSDLPPPPGQLIDPHGILATEFSPEPTLEPIPNGSLFSNILDGLRKNLNHPLSHLFVQLLTIIVVSRLTGRLFRLFGQPSVVGEMAAGILLGPSLFGWLAPDLFQFVFPKDSLGTLKLLSQIGVCLFMFSVGMEVDIRHVRDKAHTAVAVSHSSIVIPYLLGVVLAYFLYSHLAAPRASFISFALFMGISMSITAFPVLARILQERNMVKTSLGNTAITCAAIGDITAWSILAFVVAIVSATSLSGSALNLVLAGLFVIVMVFGVRRILPLCIGQERFRQEEMSKGVLAMIICVVMASALCTEVIGVHALFGAFLAGAIMPDVNQFRHKINLRVENFSTVLLLPLFFAVTGLQTEVGLLNDVSGGLTCLLIIAVATLGKLGGSAMAARFSGLNWSESLQLGALMNTRGLMELIALNIGYELGILSPRIFAMLVIMALATTMLTGPLLTVFAKVKR